VECEICKKKLCEKEAVYCTSCFDFFAWKYGDKYEPRRLEE